MTILGNDEYYLLGILLTAVDEHIGTFWSFREIARPSFTIYQVKQALTVVEQHQFASLSMVSTLGVRRKADPMIQLTSQGLAFCLMHEAEVLSAAMGGDIEQLVAVRDAFGRIRATGTVDSSLWTGLSKRMNHATAVEIRAGVQTLVQVIEQSDLDPAMRENALAYAVAVKELIRAPEPPWKVIVDLLTAKPLTAFLNAAAVLTLIFQALK